ncbi:COG2426 family protein [Guggenheimella bovis]
MKYLIAFLLGATPILEVRGALPYAVASGVPMPWTLVLPILGNILVILPILYLFDPFYQWLKKQEKLKGFTSKLDHIIERSLNKVKNKETFEFLGLFLFVAIPLPGTGAWTGSLIAVILGMKKGRSFLACALGVLGASAIMYTLSIGAMSLIK